MFGWQGHRKEAPKRATREIVAAFSKSHAARLAGFRYVSHMFNLNVTASELEVQTAMAEPGVVFWSPLDQRPRHTFTRVEPIDAS